MNISDEATCQATTTVINVQQDELTTVGAQGAESHNRRQQVQNMGNNGCRSSGQHTSAPIRLSEVQSVALRPSWSPGLLLPFPSVRRPSGLPVSLSLSPASIPVSLFLSPTTGLHNPVPAALDAVARNVAHLLA
ncbi:hypothetical protein NLJ89_g4991 [Agrocybe chaxingu]|uniref:Uncharacterized protein n=1 Tax=Agrocybe chaxingu TaxID=84603 RepID=A0A9W8MU16_9AGAR|nr:hypothetical protein NLJ89_g4991 [Agrocybe chaxingu]